MKKTVKTICALVLSAALVVYYSGYDMGSCMTVNVTAKKKEEQKEYLVKTKTAGTVEKIRNSYEESTQINGNRQDLLEENRLVSVTLSQEEADRLSEEDRIVYMEEDAVVEASSPESGILTGENRGKEPHAKKEKRKKKNKSASEWNVRMIKADKAKKNGKKGKKPHGREKIKVAVLDSGVDCGNDISLAYSISLVPGEEEMTPVFMDGSGHGSSVAGLLAAEDNGEGITGINPNAEIYSIRVLDDANQAPLSRVIEGIYLAIEKDVDIINMSFGLDTYSEALEEAVRDAADAGILVVAAAGNTAGDGVQYPAAYNEVIAVGSVDKEGEAAASSAKGEELELVAPGELVETTGFLGTELVTSGTSLAAPQVAGVASLIWEKDPDVSADFVRSLLSESANLYGETEAYGNGLVDAEYALGHYDEFKEKYESQGQEEQLLEENTREIITFDDTGCVEGCWSQDDHENMIAANYFNVRYGARFPDTSRYGDENHRVFARMSLNPWWHGYYTTNYIKAVMYATRMGDAIYTYGLYEQYRADKLGYSDSSEMYRDVQQINWAAELSRINSTYNKTQKDTPGFRRAFLWGMAIHSATDTYAHSVRYNGDPIMHDSIWVEGVEKKKADYPGICRERFLDAHKIAQQMMTKYNNKQPLQAGDLILSPAPTKYRLYNVQRYMMETDMSVAYLVGSYTYNSTK